MPQTSEGSSITGWILELGGGKDPSWAASTIRTAAAWIGWWTLYHNNVDYGDYTYLARFAASSAIALFSASLVIKCTKSSISLVMRRSRRESGRKLFMALGNYAASGNDAASRIFTAGMFGRRVVTLNPKEDATRHALSIGVIRDAKPAELLGKFADNSNPDRRVCVIAEDVYEYVRYAARDLKLVKENAGNANWDKNLD